jgi:hypothetical protein
MDETSRDDIRKLLRTFGVRADEAITAYLARSPGDMPLRLKVTLEDITAYGDQPPQPPLALEIEAEVRR